MPNARRKIDDGCLVGACRLLVQEHAEFRGIPMLLHLALWV